MKNLLNVSGRNTARWMAVVAFGILASVGPAGAMAGVALPELHGVPEQLGAHRLAVDGDELWALVLLIAVVATLWVFHRNDRSK